MTKRLILTLLSVLICGFSQAQITSVTATLRDAKSGEPMAFTNCVLLHTDSTFAYGTTTNDRGTMRFASVDSGEYLLRVSTVGYETHWQRLNVPPDTALGVIEIFQSSTTLQAVSVTAQRPLYSADGEKTFYHVEDDPSVQAGTASDALQNAPGVEVDAEGNITYRGKTAVEVWINSRPSNMDGEALKQYIKTLPASSIKRIEVLSNPSARYGTSGSIINIVTDGRNPLNQLLSIGFKASTGPRFSPWVSYVYNNDKLSLNLYGSAYLYDINIDREKHSRLLTNDSLLSATEDYTSSQSQRSRNYNIGGKLDYHFDDRNTFSAWAWFYPQFFHLDADFDVSRIEHISNPGDYSYRSNVDAHQHYISGNVGAYYQHKFDTAGREIEFNWNGGLTSGLNDRIRQRQYVNFPTLDFTRHSNLDQWGSRNGLYVNYTHPYSKKGKIEAGAEFHYKPQNQTHHLDTLAGGIYQRDSVRSYVFNDRETKLTFYLTVQQKVGRLTLKGGLRGENQWLQRKHSIASCDFDKYYFGLVPSIHASYATEKNHNFTLSYTRRFDTPDIAKLSPFIIYADDSYTVGNPDLRMAYIHKAEAGWTHYTDWGSVGVEGYLNLSTDNFAQVSDVAYSPYFGYVVQMDTAVNAGNVRMSGAELNLTWRPRKFMNIRLYGGVEENWYRMQVRPGEWVADEILTYMARLNMNAKLWGKVDVFVNSKFVGPGIQLLSRSEPYFNVDFGLSTDLFDHHLSLYFQVNDLFQSSNTHTVSTNPYYAEDYHWSYNSRFVSLGITWRIGKLDLERKGRQGAAY